MGMFERKLRKNQEREAFKQFSREWARLKAEGFKIDGLTPLGKRPSFSEFRKRVRMAEEAQKQRENEIRIEAEKQVDLEWKEQ